MTLTDGEQDIVDAYHVMQGVTAGLLGATALGGTVNLYNLPTTFGDGACARNEAIFGSYGCSGGYSLLHGAMGILSLLSYTATGVLGLVAPDLDQGGEDTVTDVLGAASAAALGLTGALGLLAAHPEVLGIDSQDREEFSRHMRIVHVVVALVAASAFATHVAVDQL